MSPSDSTGGSVSGGASKPSERLRPAGWTRPALDVAIVAAFGLTAIMTPARATAQPGFVSLPYTVEGEARTAAVWLPAGYDPALAYPLVVYLHGSGGRGDNPARLTGEWLDGLFLTRAMIAHPERFTALVLIPRCPDHLTWASVAPGPEQPPWRRALPAETDDAIAHVDRAIEAARARFRVKGHRIALTGFSMGAHGSLRYAALRPDRVAAIAAVAGVVTDGEALQLPDVPVRVFQGSADPVVPAAFARRMARTLENAGRDITYTEYAGRDHLIGGQVYGDAEVVRWLVEASFRTPE